MRTLDLKQAAAFLNMSREALRQKAKAQQIPGTKPGKEWVFIEEDLVAYLRSHYAILKQAAPAEEIPCLSTDAEGSGGFVSPRPTDDEYASLLKLPSARKRKSTTTR